MWAVLQILDWVFGFLTLALLGRVLMQWTRVSFRNPLGNFIFAVTDWAVKPARRLIPSAWGIDLPSLLLAWLAQALYLGLSFGLSGAAGSLFAEAFGAANLGTVALLALFAVARLAVQLLMGVVLVSALLSWINPHAPLAPLINGLARPFLQPLQRVIPPLGGIDITPMVLLLLLQLLLGLIGSLSGMIVPRILFGG